MMVYRYLILEESWIQLIDCQLTIDNYQLTIDQVVN